ncbi:MAG: hypothetical protein FWC20_11705 [Oscillospiraceae bacterium]|nr:hypothetical protein [Oscillospiraceae bacterium]MCL2280048.1 hypothetical protein [Oscillospiraceae bacterium]
MKKIDNATEMLFIHIAEVYPDEFILTKIVEMNLETGRKVGIAIYTAPSWDELLDYAIQEGITQSTRILTGVNRVPMIGGLI